MWDLVFRINSLSFKDKEMNVICGAAEKGDVEPNTNFRTFTKLLNLSELLIKVNKQQLLMCQVLC